MNRLEAEKYIGKRIWIDKNKDGEYTGDLIQIHAPKGKPWSGTIQIKTVETCPDIDSSDMIKEPIYREDDEVTLTGSMLSPISDHHSSTTHTFEESYILALIEQAETIKEDVHANAQILEQIYNRLSELDQTIIESLVHENGSDDYDEFELKRFKDLHVCVSKRSGLKIILDFLPVHAIIDDENRAYPLIHDKCFRFLSPENEEVMLEEGQSIWIQHHQYDPYMLIRNELEQEGLQILTRTLADFGLQHEDVFLCHNALLQLPIESVSSSSNISGTHLINFHKNNLHFVLQHHFERNYDEEPVYRYDRFELTSNTGQRTVSVYTNDSASNSSHKK